MPKESKKELILKVSKRLFAQNGYDATGMEDIAAQAGVPKSLIYYHFKGKEDLLNTITAGFLEEYSRILHTSDHGIDKISIYMAFLKENRDCARILIGESLKAGSGVPLIFRTLTPLMELDAAATDGAMGQDHWIAEFFTSILPSLLFACYEDNWCEYFHVTEDLLEAGYLRAYKLTHGAYHEFIDRESN